MEVESNGAAATGAREDTNRRKSRRSIRKPDLFLDESHAGSILTSSSVKRKRATNGFAVDQQDGEDASDSDSDSSESESESASEGEADEEELKERRRGAKGKRITGKPVSKKPKLSNNRETTLAIRSANVQGKTTSTAAKLQKARARQSQVNQEGLYADVFGHGKSGEQAAADWLRVYNRHSINAMRDLVNFILKCTGCDLKVESHDIEDVDNVPSKLGDLQDEHQQAKIADYPLISKLKQYVGFRQVLIEFFTALIKTLHVSSTLYEDKALFENLQIWVDTMSSSGIRPFRHTATFISLTMSTAFCEVARDLQASISTTRGQVNKEKEKKSVNKGRVSAMQKTMTEDEAKLVPIENILKDDFDAVFVHRYRDVDPRIRGECVSALGMWILTYRSMFLEGQYLRYLGWVLSDTAPGTRSEVIKQLKLLFKNPKNVPALKAFTDRFRPRMVEMAARDAEPGVRADTIDLLDKLRDAELLEPDDIDTVGRLIYDTDSRVRKAVAKFFVSNIEDLYHASIEGIEEEQYTAALPKAGENDDYSIPTQSWIKFKCLAETLTTVDGDEDAKTNGQYGSRNMLVAGGLDSRYMLATQAIFPHIKELQDWESLAGYLLHDHSQITSAPDDTDAAEAVQGIYKLNEGEEAVLLQVLDYAVKLYLLQLVEPPTGKKGGRKTRADKDSVQEKQELAAHNLRIIIPQLLSKFGSVPQAASAILRLEHLLNVDMINDLQQSQEIYSALLEDINKQFMTHSDRNVLAEASIALLNARTSEQSKEATDSKVQEMWEDALSTLQNLVRNQSLGVRGTLSSNVLGEVSNIVSRLSNLASILDCTSILETRIASPTNKNQQRRPVTLTPLDLLLEIAKRGVPDEETAAQFGVLEDELSTSVLKTILFYFMWKVQAISSSVTSGELRHLSSDLFTTLHLHLTTFNDTLTSIITNRTPLDLVRLTAISVALDLYTLFSTLRHVRPAKGLALVGDLTTNIQLLVNTVPASLQTSILQTHDRLEKSFARKSRRKLEDAPAPEPGEDDAPIDSDDEPEDEDEDEIEDMVEAGGGRDSKKQAALIAEQSLCDLTGKIVLAIIARVLDNKVKEKVLRNKTRLGANYKEVLAYLEEKKKKNKKGGNSKVAAADDSTKSGRGAGAAGKKRKPNAKSEVMVIEDDDIEDSQMEEERRVDDDDDDDDDDEDAALKERGLVEDELEEPVAAEQEQEQEDEGEEVISQADSHEGDADANADVDEDEEVDDLIGD